MRSSVEEYFDEKGNNHSIVKHTTNNPMTNEKYVIAHSVNVQKEIASSLKSIKWLLVLAFVGLLAVTVFGAWLYLKLDALNVLSLLR